MTTASNLDAELLRKMKAMKQAASPLEAPTTTAVSTANLGAAVKRFGPNAEHFSTVFGFTPTLAQGIDHALPVFKDTDWHEQVRMFIPAIDPDYVFPPVETELVAMSIVNGDKVLVHGPMGSGKSALLDQICARLGIPYIRVNCRRDMESSAIFGQPTFSNGAVGYVHGPAGVLAQHGGLLCIDEISAAPAGINLAMQFMLEKNGKVYLPDLHTDKPGDRYITPHEWFRVGATDNTTLQGDATGRYVGTNVQNSAFLDRFATAVELDYLGESHESAILSRRYPTLDLGVRNNIVAVAKQVRTAFQKGTMNMTMSPRAEQTWAEKAVFWGDYVLAFKYSFFNKLTDDDRKQMVEIFSRVTKIDLLKVK